MASTGSNLVRFAKPKDKLAIAPPGWSCRRGLLTMKNRESGGINEIPRVPSRFQDTFSEVGLLTIDKEGHVETDPVAHRLLGGDDSALLETSRKTIKDQVAAAMDFPIHSTVTVARPGDTSTMEFLWEARRLAETVVVQLLSSASSDVQLRREGAIAWSIRSLHRQTAHEMRGNLHAINLNLVLLGRAARGELETLSNLQERRQEWVRAIEDELERMRQGFDLWTRALVGTDEESRDWDLRRFLSDLDTLLTPWAQRRNIELEIRYPETAVTVDVPRREFTRLLTSVAVASIQSIEEGDRLLLELEALDECALLKASGDTETAEGESRAEKDGQRLADSSWEPVVAIFQGYLDELGGSFEAHGRTCWTMGFRRVVDKE